MDGGQISTRTRRGRRRSGALMAVTAAMLPGALLWSGDRAAADAPPASMRYAVGTSGMTVAQDLARRTWGVDPCGGQVEVVWGSDEPNINARSYWANPRSAYDAPELNSSCRIVFNAGLPFSWEKFCTVLVHEYGHLAGRPHSADGPDVMSPIYRAPAPDCANTPDPVAPPAPVPPAAPAPPAQSALDAPGAGKPARRSKQRRTGARAATATTRAHGAPRSAPADARPLLRFSAAHTDEHHHERGPGCAGDAHR
ncbi:MAG TPA: hypothetical protein VIL49_01995 [Capillimicrobium sp.]|jgi:hypothetical protein